MLLLQKPSPSNRQIFRCSVKDVNVVEDFHDLLNVMNDADLNEFQYTVEDGEWIVHLK